jgi:riboflavin kinase/FMN adenylyltransferase
MFDTGIVLLEVYLFDFSGDLYGRTLDVAFIAWIREEKFFGSIDELVQAINQDSRQARDALSHAANVVPPIRGV